MTIKSDKWIRKMAVEHSMIEPFQEDQIRYSDDNSRLISYGLSSYGYDVKVTGNSRIESATIKSFFTNINSQKDFNKALKRLHETKIFSDIHII